jgi:hypothetical protein
LKFRTVGSGDCGPNQVYSDFHFRNVALPMPWLAADICRFHASFMLAQVPNDLLTPGWQQHAPLG